MLWNKKRVGFQVYKEKKQNSFLIAYDLKPNYYNDSQDVFCSVGWNPEPKYSDFCHSSTCLDYLYKDCYPVSQRELKKYPKWYEFFNHYINEV